MKSNRFAKLTYETAQLTYLAIVMVAQPRFSESFLIEPDRVWFVVRQIVEFHQKHGPGPGAARVKKPCDSRPSPVGVILKTIVSPLILPS